VAKPELGTKRHCPNCGAKYYDLNRDPIMCPKCNALFATGLVAVSPVTARGDDDEDETETEDEGVEFVSLEDAVEPDSDDDAADIDVGDDVEVDVDTDDAALIDDGDDDEVSDVVRGPEDDEDER